MQHFTIKTKEKLDRQTFANMVRELADAVENGDTAHVDIDVEYIRDPNLYSKDELGPVVARKITILSRC